MSKKQIDYTLFNKIITPIIEREKYQTLKGHMAHSNITTYAHCLQVAKLSYEFAIKHNVKCDIEALVKGALLHDYYLYDWHNNPKGTWHGFKHPKIAMQNAKADYNITDKEASIIKTHMFPLTILSIPTCKEGWIVTLMDKKTAISETLLKYKKGYKSNDKK